MKSETNKMMNYVLVAIFSAYFLLQNFTFLNLAVDGRKIQTTVYLELKEMGQYQFGYFTLWVYVLQMIFVATAILDEIGKLYDAPTRIRNRLEKFRSFIFYTLVLPCSLLVASVFWTLWHIDRELIFPKVIDLFLPTWINHSLHTFILFPVCVELLQLNTYSLVKFSHAFKILGVYLIIYQTIYVSIYFFYGVWLYPIYNILTWPQRILFTIGQFGLAMIYLRIGISIQTTKKVTAPQKLK